MNQQIEAVTAEPMVFPVAETDDCEINFDAQPVSQDELFQAPQPDSNGEFACPADGAKFMASFGVPQTPLNGKKPFMTGWQNRASCDFDQIDAWAREFVGCNFGSVAKLVARVPFVFEADSLDVKKRFAKDTGNASFTRTLTIESRAGRGHRWYLHSAESVALGNVSQQDVIGKDFSVRADREQAVSPGSVHPDSGKQYRVVLNTAPVAVSSDEVLWWKSQKASADKPAQDDGLSPILEPGRNNALASIGGKLRNLGLDADGIFAALSDINDKRCEPALSEAEVRTIAQSVARYKVTPDRPVLFGGKLSKGTEPVLEEPISKVDVSDDSETIPEFDPSVVNGIYAKIVELATRKTTLSPQFSFVIAKTMIGARMAGKVVFENLDVEPRLYTALIGETGSGKGEAWRRVRKIFDPEGGQHHPGGIKIIDSSDSGAGLKDFFFEPPDALPVLCFIDEVQDLGNKAAGTRNPAILDTMITLADSTSVTRNLAKRSGGTKTKNDARLSMVMCGQEGSIFMKAFAGQTKVGLWDRLYPEHGVAQETGDLPRIDPTEAMRLLMEIDSLDFSGTMKFSQEAKVYLDNFWKNQPPEVRKKARWKKNLQLDAFMSAFGRGQKTVSAEDVSIAIRIFTRQLVIRRVHFTSEVPDRTGYYLGLIKQIAAKMERELAAGLPEGQVALSERDFATRTNAFRDNELHVFRRAWEVFQSMYLERVQVRGRNGREYTKYLPVPSD